MENGDFVKGKGIYHNGKTYYLVKSGDNDKYEGDFVMNINSYLADPDTGEPFTINLFESTDNTTGVDKKYVWEVLNILNGGAYRDKSEYFPDGREGNLNKYDPSFKIFWKNNKAEYTDEDGETIIVFKQQNSFKF